MSKLTITDIEKILQDRIKDDQFKTLKSFPQPDKFKDMDKAVKRIVDAIKHEETINLVGDYDVDGVVSTAIMVEFFSKIGVDINYIIPNRFEHGYGLSPKILEQIDEGIIITVDNGISAFEAADICKQKGLDLIITDHHTVGEKLPDAYAIVNPKQEECPFDFKDICGAQVAWYLCAAIKNALNFKYNLMELFDILALAIVADIMPMVSLNQTMVKYGLKALSTSKRPAIAALRLRYRLNSITEEDIGFKFAPLINCAGRMSDPSIALEFLLSFDEREANMQLDYLVELNEARKQEQLSMFNEAKTQVDEEDDVIVVKSSSWNEGIIGIVASKLCEKYQKPAFVFSVNGQNAKASARSTSDVDLYELISLCSLDLVGFGGHKQAAGLTALSHKIDDFKDMLNKNIDNLNSSDDKGKSLYSIGSFCIDSINENLYNTIEFFRPFGHQNPYPIFTFENLKVLNVIKMGKNKEFKKLIVTNGINTIEVVVFVDLDEINIDDIVSFTATVSKNEFRGNTTINLMFKQLI
ncbi:MAG: single-stranded-DNA-specific exonuclease RecJ [Campylobacterota bacterium]|nr:single-stranded-DNA-specific exonuclease RecJ [Campylobacterota bacterium]